MAKQTVKQESKELRKEIRVSTLLCDKPFTANIITPASETIWDEVDGIFAADKRLRDLTQNIIDSVDDHVPLRTAKILLLVKLSAGDAKKLENGQRVTLGKAQKAGAKQRALMASFIAPPGKTSEKHLADFVITLSGDWLKSVEALNDGNPLVDCAGVRKAIALIDHELMHCTAKLNTKFISRDDVDRYVEELGEAYCDTVDVDKGDAMVMVRSYVLKNRKRVYMMRKHDLEEFCNIVERHGGWEPMLARMGNLFIKRSGVSRN